MAGGGGHRAEGGGQPVLLCLGGTQAETEKSPCTWDQWLSCDRGQQQGGAGRGGRQHWRRRAPRNSVRRG